MSSISVAVFGYGTLGKPLVSALAAQGAKVLLLSRDASKLQDVPATVKTASVDYTNEAQVVNVLKENVVDVAAGVKLFVPAEFGLNAEGHAPGSLFGAKSAALAKIQEIGIPTARVVTGVFTELVPWLTSATSKPGEFVVAGKGDKKVSFTALADIGGYVAHILTTIPLSELYNKSFIIEGEAATFQEVAQILGKTITYVSPEEIDQPFVRFLQELADKGGVRAGYLLEDADASEGVVSKRSTSGNALWKGHQWKQIKDIHATYI